MSRRIVKRRLNIQRPYNAGTWTEAQYMSKIRSALRRAFMFWVPIVLAKKAARRPYVGANKAQKWEYRCAMCGGWFQEKQIQVDHVVPVGSFKPDLSDLGDFVKRLASEDPQCYRVLCRERCHKEVTNEQRKLRNKSCLQ